VIATIAGTPFWSRTSSGHQIAERRIPTPKD
jgi:hypothetical protein